MEYLSIVLLTSSLFWNYTSVSETCKTSEGKCIVNLEKYSKLKDPNWVCTCVSWSINGRCKWKESPARKIMVFYTPKMNDKVEYSCVSRSTLKFD